MLSDGYLVIVSLEVFSLSLIPFHFFDLHCSLTENFYRPPYSLIFTYYLFKSCLLQTNLNPDLKASIHGR